MRRLAALSAGVILLYASSWLLPSNTAGISLGGAVHHRVRRCLRPMMFMCMPHPWQRLGGMPSSPVQLYSVRPFAPTYQRVIVVPGLLDDRYRASLLATVRHRSFEWTLNRHTNYPTTDQEMYLLPDADVAFGRLLRDRLLPSFRAFGVNASFLVMGDLFVVRYRAEAQAALARHADTSALSFIVQLNDLSEFDGGGTLFDFASAPLSVPAGSALLFSGRLHHQGVRVTRGERFILAGFVSLSAPSAVVEHVAAQIDEAGGVAIPHRAPYTHNALVNRPDLRHNAALLRLHAGGTTGMRLVQQLSNGRVHVPHEDSRGLGAACQHWLATGMVGPESWGGRGGGRGRGRRRGRRRGRQSAAPNVGTSDDPLDHTSHSKSALAGWRIFARFLIDAVGRDEVERRLRLANGTAFEGGRREEIAFSDKVVREAKKGEWVAMDSMDSSL